MKFCPSIAPTTMSNAVVQLRELSKSSDIVEVRIDGISDLNLEQLLQKPRPQLIITNRRVEEGGKYIGSLDEQLRILSQAINLGAEYVDVELSRGNVFIHQILMRSSKTKVICSYHNFQETPADLIPIYNSIRRTGAHIVKIATMAKDITDNKPIFNLLMHAQKDQQKTIALCMGETGQISRILSGIFDGYLSYTTVSNEKDTAPGQLLTEDLKKTFRGSILNKSTNIFGLVGNPIIYSQGIYYHNKLFTQRKANAVYVNFFVTDLRKFVITFRDIILGLSITMPFKQEIVNFVDKVKTDVAGLNVLNTVIKKKDKLIGYNTDLPAIVSILKKRTSLKQKEVIVLGTGATAKTMAYAATGCGAAVTIVGRNPQKSKALANEIDGNWATFENLTALKADVLINATPVGMIGMKSEQLVPKSFLKKRIIVFDAVYNPPLTPLLKNAKSAGCEIITGTELFEQQAQLQSKLFLECMK